MASKKLLIGCSLAAVVAVVVVVLVAAVLMFTGAGHEIGNYFRPSAAVGTFPPEIAGFKLTGEVRPSDYLYRDTETSEFRATYGNDKGQVLTLAEFVFKKSEDAVATLKMGNPSAGGLDYQADRNDTRAIAYGVDKRDIVEVATVAGNYLITFSVPDAESAANVENSLPYQAFGAQAPPKRSADDYPEQPVLVLKIIEEADKDLKAATAKYDGKTMLFAGPVGTPAKIAGGTSSLAIADTSTTEKALHFILVTFAPQESANAAKLKVKYPVVFRGTITHDKDLDMLMINNASVVQPK